VYKPRFEPKPARILMFYRLCTINKVA